MHVHRLANGQQIYIRPISADDKWRLQEGLRNLSLETVRRRFLAAKPRFSSTELKYLTEVDGVNHLALVAISVPTGRLVAVARAVRLPEDPETAEWAIVVADPLQGLGLGSHLMKRLADEAQAVGIHRFSASMLGDNVAVRRLLAQVTEHLESDVMHDGLREVLVDLAA